MRNGWDSSSGTVARPRQSLTTILQSQIRSSDAEAWHVNSVENKQSPENEILCIARDIAPSRSAEAEFLREDRLLDLSEQAKR